MTRYQATICQCCGGPAWRLRDSVYPMGESAVIHIKCDLCRRDCPKRTTEQLAAPDHGCRHR